MKSVWQKKTCVVARCLSQEWTQSRSPSRLQQLAAKHRSRQLPRCSRCANIPHEAFRGDEVLRADSRISARRQRSAPFSSGDFISGQVHENDRAEVVIVCEPDMHSNIMGALHPAGSLYERPVNMRSCTAQHEAFRAALRANGVRCLTVREILLYDTEASVRSRVELEDLAASRLNYALDPACDELLLAPADRFYIGDEYVSRPLHRRDHADMPVFHLQVQEGSD